jgi:hypothetical protein
MTNYPNETPEPLAGPSVESCATALAEALRREKGWLLHYADSVIRDAIDRKHLEPLAQEQAGEYRSLYELSGCITDANTMLIGRYELKAKDAEIAGLKAVIRDHNADCESQCEQRQQSGDAHCPYAKYGRQCPDCPRDGMLDAMKGEAA